MRIQQKGSRLDRQCNCNMNAPLWGSVTKTSLARPEPCRDRRLRNPGRRQDNEENIHILPARYSIRAPYRPDMGPQFGWGTRLPGKDQSPNLPLESRHIHVWWRQIARSFCRYSSDPHRKKKKEGRRAGRRKVRVKTGAGTLSGRGSSRRT